MILKRKIINFAQRMNYMMSNSIFTSFCKAKFMLLALLFSGVNSHAQVSDFFSLYFKEPYNLVSSHELVRGNQCNLFFDSKVFVANDEISEVQNDTVRILAIGNSFSEDALEYYFHKLARAGGHTVIVGNAYIGGCSLERHVRNSREDKSAYSYRKINVNGDKTVVKNVSLSKIISDEEWDYISLQQSSPLSGKYETYAEWLPELCEYVASVADYDFDFILHQTWAYEVNSTHKGFMNYDCSQRKMYESIVEANKKAADMIGINIIVPSGTAIQNARLSVIGDNMTRDGYHLNLLWGRYTAACTWYEKLFGGVVGNSYAPEGMEFDYIRACQMAAYHAVLVTDGRKE